MTHRSGDTRNGEWWGWGCREESRAGEGSSFKDSL